MSSPVYVGTGGPLRGRIQVPGDKSVSHRALLLNALANGPARIEGLLHSEDVEATLGAVRALGVVVEKGAQTVVRPPAQLTEPRDVLDCGNSGTSMRLLCGVLSGLPLHAVLTGDASLRQRPMARVAAPLRRMGARIDGRDGGRLAPLSVRGGDLAPTDHVLDLSSAQVKSALLLAGLRCGVRVREPGPSRDHTERMLARMGADIRKDDEGFWALRPSELAPVDVTVPGDPSAAAFLLVAATLVEGSDVVIEALGVNPTRTGVIDALRLMGADIEVTPRDWPGAEPVADVRVRSAALRGVRIDGDLALRSLDELPVLSVAAAFAEGETVIADAAELRVKESDRIARMAGGLRGLGFDVEERPDGMVIEGGRPRWPTTVDATGDHRIAMSFAVASAAGADVGILGSDAVRSSWPSFFDDLESLRA